ncbi:hypothetical protein GCM10010207_67480 [Streptomyces atratus]|nr:hypothetical protein GCM10010207_67480 [Streptomyces atratus]
MCARCPWYRGKMAPSRAFPASAPSVSVSVSVSFLWFRRGGRCQQEAAAFAIGQPPEYPGADPSEQVVEIGGRIPHPRTTASRRETPRGGAQGLLHGPGRGTFLNGGRRRRDRRLRLVRGAFDDTAGDGVGDALRGGRVLATGAFQRVGDERKTAIAPAPSSTRRRRGPVVRR